MKQSVEQILNAMKEKKIIDDGTFTNFYGGKTDNGYKLKINGEQTAVEFILNLDLGLDEQGKEFRVKDALSVNEIRKAKAMEAKQNEKYNELKEVIEDMIKHLDEGIHLTLRKDSILVEALRNSINKK